MVRRRLVPAIIFLTYDILPSTYAYAALAVTAASLTCWLFVRRRLDRLDLIAVLKTRE